MCWSGAWSVLEHLSTSFHLPKGKEYYSSSSRREHQNEKYLPSSAPGLSEDRWKWTTFWLSLCNKTTLELADLKQFIIISHDPGGWRGLTGCLSLGVSHAVAAGAGFIWRPSGLNLLDGALIPVAGRGAQLKRPRGYIYVASSYVVGFS